MVLTATSKRDGEVDGAYSFFSNHCFFTMSSGAVTMFRRRRTAVPESQSSNLDLNDSKYSEKGSLIKRSDGLRRSIQKFQKVASSPAAPQVFSNYALVTGVAFFLIGTIIRHLPSSAAAGRPNEAALEGMRIVFRSRLGTKSRPFYHLFIKSDDEEERYPSYAGLEFFSFV